MVVDPPLSSRFRKPNEKTLRATRFGVFGLARLWVRLTSRANYSRSELPSKKPFSDSDCFSFIFLLI